MQITSEIVRELREKTGAGMMDCKRALSETGGDMEKAIDYLRKKGIASAAKRAHRTALQGRVEAYVHPGDQIAVLVEINAETDFVAKTEDFKRFCHDVAMQIAASRPLAIRPEELDPAVVAKEREILIDQVKNSGKPEAIWEKIVDGKLNKFYADTCLLHQPWIRDGAVTIDDLRKALSGKVGENIVIRRFVCFQVGQES